MHGGDHLYILAYDIRDQKRWRRLYKAMQGRGEWLQLSVFQCRLSRRGLADLTTVVDDIIKHVEDHVVILDLGLADEVKPRITSFGKGFDAVTRQAIIV
jgi:CRISPR-associated endonuclease Cas2